MSGRQSPTALGVRARPACCRSTRSPATTPRRTPPRKPSRRPHSVPRAMVMSVRLVGPLRLSVPGRLRADDPEHGRGGEAGLERVLLGLRPAGQPGLKEFVYLVVFVAQFLCGLATVTSASRMIFAFSRDGGLPGSSALARSARPIARRWRRSGRLDPVGAVRLGFARWSRSPAPRPTPSSCPARSSSCSCPSPCRSCSALMAWGTPKWDKMGPWDIGRGVFMLFAVLSIAVDDPDLLHRHPAAERLGALHHRRLLRS